MARDASRRPTSRGAGKVPTGRGGASGPARPRREQRPRDARRAATPQMGGARAPRPRGPLTTDQPRERRQRHQRAQALRVALLAAGALIALALVTAVTLFALRDSSVFEITSIEFEATEHISASDVESLAQVPAGSTLLNVDTAAIEEALRQNPWVGMVSFERAFPHTLRIVIAEQTPDLLVVMSSGSLGWYLGDAGAWIEPVSLQTKSDESARDLALSIAQESGCVLVTDVPATVDPSPGAAATDEVLAAVQQFREGFSEGFSSQIVSFSAPSVDNVSCTLQSGVEVSLGSAEDIGEKESIVTSYLEEYPGSVIYINVRVVSSPAYRDIGSENVQQGEGVTSSSEDAPDDTSDGASTTSDEGSSDEASSDAGE